MPGPERERRRDVRPRPSPERVVLPVPRVAATGHGYIERPMTPSEGELRMAPGGGEAPAITDLPIGEYGGRIFSTRLGTTSGVVRNRRRIRTAS